MNRPTISEIQKIFNNEIKGKCFNLPLTKNKGLPGIILENKLGIPNSTACLDCADGELKLFLLKKLKNGTIVPKETIAITTNGLSRKSLIQPKKWIDSGLKKKTNNILFISYFRDETTNNITYLNSYKFDSTHSCYVDFENDYNKLIEHFKTYGIRSYSEEEKTNWKNKYGKKRMPSLNTINGKYIQIRTKGQGNGAPKTIAFYFRKTEFVKKIIMNINNNK